MLIKVIMELVRFLVQYPKVVFTKLQNFDDLKILFPFV